MSAVGVRVIGGGVIGLSVAWFAARAGFAVTVVDRPSPHGGSWVAGGMLAPITEAWPGEEDVLDLGVESLTRWPDFARDLGVPLSDRGTLAVAVDSADVEVLDQLRSYLTARGRAAERLTGRELRAREPGFGRSVRSGLSVPGDVSVDNRVLLRALRDACTAHGVRFEPDTPDPATSSEADAPEAPARSAGPGTSNGPARGVRHAPEPVDAPAPGSDRARRPSRSAGPDLPTPDVTVIAAGAWSGGLHPLLRNVIRPLKGEIVRLAARPGALPPPAHTLRAHVEGRPLYLVPRAGGLVLGATQYEAGFDGAATAGGVLTLLRDAEVVWPGVAEYAVVETAAGFRAGSPDNAPVIRWLEPGVLAATGHHRNGLLLAPVTAERVLTLLREGGPRC
ncbi:FAD-dependent oxidoreductase [Actinosynnema sp. NPDC020468]|uniref:FAD-dependent oxidoreductase n=1 Tax=Actinosynnema sp. NPDC020468 TaxID=3154488 RepID=UPI0033C292B7